MSGLLDDIQCNPADPNDIFELVELLGEGSYGAVYKANYKSDPSLDPVAIKIIPADEDLSSLKREIAILNKCRCAFVVEFKDCFFIDNELWIVMEFCLGGSVSDMLDATDKTLTEAQIRCICACVAIGLAYLHENHNIHRDLKAGNILLSTDGKAKLADFGVSAQLNNTLSKRKTVIGTPFWMAPEVIQESSYDGKADVWSLGITAIEMAEGMPPHFNVHPMRAIFLIPSKPPPKLTEPGKWSNEFNDFVKCCLVKDPVKRIDSQDLLTHPFIRREVEYLMEDPPKGLEVITQLIDENMEYLKKMREDDSNEPAAEDHEADPDQTSRPAPHSNSGTMQSRSTSRSPKGVTGGNEATMVRHNRRATDSKADGESATATLVRTTSPRSRGHDGTNSTPIRHRRVSSSDMAQTGTMVRHNRPSSRKSSVAGDDLDESSGEMSGTTNFRGTSNKPDENPGLQSALRYFQGMSGSGSSQGTPRAQGCPTTPSTDATSLTLESITITIPPPPTSDSAAPDMQPLTYHERKLRELKTATAEEIKEQLKALDFQYREDLEALTRSYQVRKKELEEALQYC